MRSRVLIGASAWLLGAVTATTGSMIAVNQLAHGLFNQPTQLLGSSAVANLDHDSGGRSAASGSTRSHAASPSTRRPARHRHFAPAASQSTATTTPSPTSTPSAGGTQLVSPDGSVMAECLPAGAHLLYWFPDQGFQVDDVHRGPAPVASVTFEGAGGEVFMNVYCRNGTPVARVGRDH